MSNYSEISKEFNPTIIAPNYLTRNRLLINIQALVSQINGGTLLDFGCGSKPYRSLFNVQNYIGLDFENIGHPHLNENIDVFYDGKVIPFADKYFDVVFSTEVFEHVFNLEEMLKELNRVVKQGGKMLITCPFSICEHEVPNDFARYSSFGIKDLLERNGFEIIEQRKAGNSIEAIYQLRLMYIHQHITPLVKNVPIIRSAFRLFTYTLLNSMAILSSKIFPKTTDLYLNNVVLCRKKQDI